MENYRKKLYGVWKQMKQRCNNPNNKDYKYYKNVTVCDEWNKFENFYEWSINNGYRPGLKLHHWNDCYSPDTCRYVTHTENMGHTRRNVYYDVFGEQIIQSRFIQTYGICRNKLIKMLKKYTAEQIAIICLANKLSYY